MTQIDDVNEALRMGIKKIDELQQATKELKEALKDALPYVKGAYECAFPDESENDYVRDNIEALLTKYKDL